MKETTRSGTSLSTLLLVLFIGLKLTGFINWSWLWVLSPMWLSVTITVLLLFGCRLINRR